MASPSSRRHLATFGVLSSVALVWACTTDVPTSDAGAPDAARPDATGGDDAGRSDTGPGDPDATSRGDAGTDAGTDATVNPDAAAEAGSDAGADADAARVSRLPPGGAVFLVHAAAGSTSTLDRWNSGDLTRAETGTFTSLANRAARLDETFLQVGSSGGVRLLEGIHGRVDDTTKTVDPNTDREIGGGLTSPTGVLHSGNWIFVADGTKIFVFSAAAGAGASPIFELGASAGTTVWGLAEGRGHLYASQANGTVAVYEDIASNTTNRAAPTRTFSAAAPHAARSSFRGIVYDYQNDTLVVTDVGAVDAGEGAAFASDGSVLVFTGVSSASGATTPARMFAGAATGLGNPLGVHLVRYTSTQPQNDDVSRRTIYVADAATNKLSAWVDAFDAAPANTAPKQSVTIAAPEGITGDEYVGEWAAADYNYGALAVTQNAGVSGGAVNAGNYRIQYYRGVATRTNTETFAVDSAMAFDTFEGADPTVGASATRLLESIATDGPVSYVTFSATSAASSPGGGILIVNALRQRGTREAALTRHDRVIEGANTGLVDPKGIWARGTRIVVADFGASNIKVFGAHAEGNVAPLATLSNLGAATSVWDVTMCSGTLYAAATNGTVLAWDNFVAGVTTGAPTRTIAYAGGVNAHGIACAYRQASSEEVLFVSDVGTPGNTTDGAVFRIGAADTASGSVTPQWTLTGANTLLGDPVDLVFDRREGHLFVAEKANDRLLRITDPMTATGTTNVAPNDALNVTKPESAALVDVGF